MYIRIDRTTSAATPLRVALIGAGEMGRNHARVLSDMPGVKLVAIADANLAAAQAAARYKDVDAYADVDEMLDTVQPDAVVVAVPTSLHMAVAMKVIHRGIHILVEKPIALNIEEARQMIESARQMDVQLTVGHVERFNPAVIALKQMIKAGHLGRVFQVQARRQSPFPNRIRDVGVVIDLAVHDLDVIRYLTDAEVAQVYAATTHWLHETHEDSVSALLHLDNGSTATLAINWLTPAKVRELCVIGECGMFRVDYLTQDLFFYENAAREDSGSDWEAMKVLRGVREGQVVKPAFLKKEPLRAELEAFVAAARGDAPVVVSGEDGMVALQLAQLLLESSELKALVDCADAQYAPSPAYMAALRTAPGPGKLDAPMLPYMPKDRLSIGIASAPVEHPQAYSLELATLRAKIENRSAIVAVVGMGYVGLPVACEFARASYRTIGLDIRSERIDQIRQGVCPIEGNEPGLPELLAQVVKARTLHAVDEPSALSQADVITINVETPVDENNVPRYVALRAACESIGRVMKHGALVIVESTVAPGTVDRVVRPILEQMSGMRLNDGFYLGACPERVMPGKLLTNLRTLSRVCGGSTPQVAEVMRKFYAKVVNADIDATDVITAELVKTVENTYRDVQIAFANEVALICERAGADVYAVRKLVNKSPGRHMLLPGAGVGGHCIPKDPWLLAHAVPSLELRLIPAARQVNEGMPAHMVELLLDAWREAGFPLDGNRSPRVLVLGYAYLADSDDIRHSPSEVLVGQLERLGIDVTVHDPWVRGFEGDVYQMAHDCDALILMVAHREYGDLDFSRLADTLIHPIWIDGRGLLTTECAHSSKLDVWGVGRGQTKVRASVAEVI